MTDEATSEGASVHQMLMDRLDPQPSQEVITEETSEEINESVEGSSEIEAEAHDEPITEDSIEESETEVSENDAETEINESQIELSDLADYLGIDADKLDVDDDGAILVKTKIDGEEGFAKFSDLVKSHQLEGHLNKQNMEVVEQRKLLENDRNALESQYQSKITEAESIMQLAYGELTKEFESIDWNELRAQDPGEYAARQQDFNARQNALAEAYQKIQQEKQSQQFEQSQAIEAHLQEENQKLAGAIEGWDKPEIAKKEFSDVMNYLQNTYGYSSEDLYGVRDNSGLLVKPGITNHQVVVMARKAMLYDNLQQNKPTITKKVRKAPKIAKPGAIKPVDFEAKKIKDLKSKVQQTGGKSGSVAAYLLETGKV